jgi:CheY-like chemotaxis protein
MAGEAILIVEDNLGNLKLEEILFTKLGYQVRTAHDANAALEVLAEFQPQMIIMDIQLPGMSGIELTKKLKADPKYQNIIIVAVTAYAMSGDQEKILASGCDVYVAKPIDIDTFPDMIEKLLAGHE